MTETEKQSILDAAKLFYPDEPVTDAMLESLHRTLIMQQNAFASLKESTGNTYQGAAPTNFSVAPSAPVKYEQTKVVQIELDPVYELAIMIMLVALGFYFDDATETLLFANGYAEYFPNTHSIFADSSRLYGDLDEYLANVATLDA